MRTTIVKAVRWQNFDEVRGMFKDADSVDGYVVFNIRHNRYRLIAVIHYAKTSDERQTQGHVYIRSFLTHKEFHGHLLPLAEPRAFTSWLRVLFRHDWVVYAKRPSGGPEHALRYLGAYTHRVAISNSRLVALSEGNVTFRWRDSAHGNKKQLMTLPVDEFLRCFLLHLLPRGFIRIRNFGFLANRRRAEFLPLCFRLLQPSDQPVADATSPALPIHSRWRCPLCSGTMQVVDRFSAAHSFSDPRRIPAGAQHESTSSASNLARASARTFVLCLAFLRMQYRCALQTLPCVAP